jgi:hypothetical protein
MKIIIKFDENDPTFKADPKGEAVRMLRQAAEKIESQMASTVTLTRMVDTLRDHNGNVVAIVRVKR